MTPKTAPALSTTPSAAAGTLGHAVPSVPQDTLGPPGWQGTADSYLAICQGPQIPFRGTALQPHSPVCLLPHPRCGICHLTLLNFMFGCPALLIYQGYLQDLPAFEGVDSSSQFSVISKLDIPWSLASKLLMKILKRTGLSLEPIRNRLPDAAPFSVTLCAWPVSWLLCNTVIQLWASHFVQKDAVTVSKALLKSK